MELVTRVQILDKAGCSLPRTNDLWKVMNPSVLSTALGSPALDRVGEGKLNSI